MWRKGWHPGGGEVVEGERRQSGCLHAEETVGGSGGNFAVRTDWVK